MPFSECACLSCFFSRNYVLTTYYFLTAPVDSLFAELRLVASFGERASILHMVLNGFAVVVSARDACILQVAERTNEGHVWIASQSVSDPACPVHPDRVRTEVGLGGWYLELAYEGKNRPVTRLTHLFLFDAKGWVPKVSLWPSLSYR